MKRATFDESTVLPPHGRAPDPQPRRVSHRCAAHGCPMAGANAEGSHASNWWCAHHYRVAPDEFPRITSVLVQHKELRDIVIAGRTAMCDLSMDGPKLAGELKRLQDLARFAGYEVPSHRVSPKMDDVRGFTYRAEELLSGLIQRELSDSRRRGGPDNARRLGDTAAQALISEGA